MANFNPPQQYQNVQGATGQSFDPTLANEFLTNFNDASVLYSTNTANTEQQANNLIQAYQYLSDPNNQALEDQQNGPGWSQYMLGQLQNDITEQTNLANYNQANYPGQIGQLESSLGNVGNVASVSLPSQQQLQQMVNDIQNGNGGSPVSAYNIAGGQSISNYVNSLIGDITNSNSQYARSAANNAAGTSAQGFQLGADEGNIASHLGSSDPTALANWIYGYISAAQQGYQQLQDMGQEEETTQQGILQGFNVNTPDYAQGTNQLENYYGVDANGNALTGNTTGQVQLQQQQANQDIYAQAAQLRQQINAQAAQSGAQNSGSRQLALGNVSSQAAENAAKTYEQNASQAQQAIDQYNQQAQLSNQQLNAQEKQVEFGGFENLFNTGTQQAINSYNQNAEAQNQQALTGAKTDIQNNQQNNALLNGIAGAAGSGLGNIAGTALKVGI